MLLVTPNKHFDIHIVIKFYYNIITFFEKNNEKCQ